MSTQTAFRPAMRPLRGIEHLGTARRVGTHGLVEADRDVRAEGLLDGDGVLRREALGGSVEM